MNSKCFLALMLLSVSANAADMAYTICTEPTVEEAAPMLDDDLMNWTPLSVEAFGYDIHEMWRFPNEETWSWSVAVSERLDLLCDIRPHAPRQEEVWTFGGLAFSR